jgi:hypothetical protein
MKITLISNSNPVLSVEKISDQSTDIRLSTKRFKIVVDLGAIFNFKSEASKVYKIKVMCGSLVQKLSETV